MILKFISFLFLLFPFTAGAQFHHPAYFYSHGILQDVFYPADVQDISFYAEEVEGRRQYYQRVVTRRETLFYPIYEQDSLTFSVPQPMTLRNYGRLNVLTADAHRSLVYDFDSRQLSSLIRDGHPALVYYWTARSENERALLSAIAARYRDRLDFYSLDLMEETELAPHIPHGKTSVIQFYNRDGTQFCMSKSLTEKNLTEFIETILSGNKRPNDFPTVFAEGVTLHTGWYDVNKRGVPEDYMACWLITSSQMLQWWQDRYTSAGYTLPANTPNGIGIGPYRLAIFDDAMTHFYQLEKGGSIKTGLLWYIEGQSTDISNQAFPVPGTGGYLSAVSSDKLGYSLRPFMAYDDWEHAATSAEALSVFSGKLLTAFRRGDVVGMDIKTHIGFGGALHAITIWGAAYDDQNQIRGLYLTDSDDNLHQLVYAEVRAVYDPYFNTQTLALSVPANETYVNGCEWEILQAFQLSFHPHR